MTSFWDLFSSSWIYTGLMTSSYYSFLWSCSFYSSQSRSKKLRSFHPSSIMGLMTSSYCFSYSSWSCSKLSWLFFFCTSNYREIRVYLKSHLQNDGALHEVQSGSVMKFLLHRWLGFLVTQRRSDCVDTYFEKCYNSTY